MKTIGARPAAGDEPGMTALLKHPRPVAAREEAP
jgi:hypothetical protein